MWRVHRKMPREGFPCGVVVGELLWPTKTKSFNEKKRTTEKPNKTLECMCMCLPGTGTNMYMHDSRLHIHI